LVSLDRNWYESGRLQARWLIENGHRRVAVLMRDYWLPGDNRFYDGVSEEIGRAGLEPGSLVIRSLPADEAAIASEVELLLDMNNGPTGFMCRTGHKAELVKQLAEKRKRKVTSEIGVIFDGDELTTKEINLPQVCAQTSYAEQVRQVAKRLRQLLQGEEVADMHVVVPVEILKTGIEYGHSSSQ
jgi:DNA-binding LacI/PurR family transcriptional regulator